MMKDIQKCLVFESAKFSFDGYRRLLSITPIKSIDD